MAETKSNPRTVQQSLHVAKQSHLKSKTAPTVAGKLRFIGKARRSLRRALVDLNAEARFIRAGGIIPPEPNQVVPPATPATPATPETPAAAPVVAPATPTETKPDDTTVVEVPVKATK